MKKVIFALSFIGLGLVSVSCTTDAYDLPETKAMKIQDANQNLEQIFEEDFQMEGNYASKDGEEDTNNSSDNTEPVVKPPKKD